MHDNYKTDETILRNIIRNNISPVNLTSRVQLLIYYKSKRTHNLVSPNNPIKDSLLKRTNVVYQFRCPLDHGHTTTYIGHTRTTLSRRLTMHVQGGNIHAHFLNHHRTQLTRAITDANTTVLASANDYARLQVLEALYILQNRPTLNIQDEHFDKTLHLFECVDGNRFTSDYHDRREHFQSPNTPTRVFLSHGYTIGEPQPSLAQDKDKEKSPTDATKDRLSLSEINKDQHTLVPDQPGVSTNEDAYDNANNHRTSTSLPSSSLAPQPVAPSTSNSTTDDISAHPPDHLMAFQHLTLNPNITIRRKRAKEKH